jgi:hypothetical protein
LLPTHSQPGRSLFSTLIENQGNIIPGDNMDKIIILVHYPNPGQYVWSGLDLIIIIFQKLRVLLQFLATCRDHDEIYKNLRGLFKKRQGKWISHNLISNGNPVDWSKVGVVLGSMADQRRRGQGTRQCFIGAGHVGAQGRRCSPAAAGEDEQDEP